MTIQQRLFITQLDIKIKWHQDNKSDPYNIDQVAIVILEEIKDAYLISIGERTYVEN